MGHLPLLRFSFMYTLFGGCNIKFELGALTTPLIFRYTNWRVEISRAMEAVTKCGILFAEVCQALSPPVFGVRTELCERDMYGNGKLYDVGNLR